MQAWFPLRMKEMEAGNCCRGDVEHIRSLGNRPSCESQSPSPRAPPPHLHTVLRERRH